MSFQIVAITNRALCAQPLEVRVAALCDAGVDRVIVREKDLTEREFGALLDRIEALLLPDQRRRITVNTFVDLAASKGYPSIQMSYDEFERHPDFAREFQEVGVSVHGVNEPSTSNDRELISASLATSSPPNASLAWSRAVFDFLRRITRTAAIPVMHRRHRRAQYRFGARCWCGWSMLDEHAHDLRQRCGNDRRAQSSPFLAEDLTHIARDSIERIFPMQRDDFPIGFFKHRCIVRFNRFGSLLARLRALCACVERHLFWQIGLDEQAI